MPRSYLRNANNEITDGPTYARDPSPTAIIESPVPVPILVPDSSLGVGSLEEIASPHLAYAGAGAAYVAFPDPAQHHPQHPRLASVAAAAAAAAQPSVLARAAQAHLQTALLPARLRRPVLVLWPRLPLP